MPPTTPRPGRNSTTTPTPHPRPARGGGGVQLEEIWRASGAQQLFRGLTWRIPDGERIGLVGPNGAGKTTLCRLLAGVEAPDGGGGSPPRGAASRHPPPGGAGGGA